MTEPTPQQQRLAALGHWGAVLALVAAVEAAFAVVGDPPSAWTLGHRFYPSTRVPTVEESVVQWQLDRMRSTPAEIVLTGDSSAMNGLVPAAFEDATGLRAQNFGTICWATVDMHVEVFEEYLELHGAPRVVVYQMATLVHTVPHQELLAGGFRDQIAEYIGAADDLWPVPLPSLAWRRLARDWVDGQRFGAAYTDVPRGRELSDAALREFLALNQGFNVDRAPRGTWDDVVPIPPGLQVEAMLALERLFALSDEFGFELYVVHTPLPELLRERAPQIEPIYAQVEQFVRGAAEQHERVVVVGPFARWFRTDAFANVEHLTPEGAWAHSQQLAALIASRLEGPDAGSGEASTGSGTP